MKMKIPGVTVSEAAGMGSSVEMVDTAVPVFIGYSEKAVDLDGASLTGVPKRIASLGDYEEFFGGAYRETLYVDVTQAGRGDPCRAVRQSARGHDSGADAHGALLSAQLPAAREYRALLCQWWPGLLRPVGRALRLIATARPTSAAPR